MLLDVSFPTHAGKAAIPLQLAIFVSFFTILHGLAHGGIGDLDKSGAVALRTYVGGMKYYNRCGKRMAQEVLNTEILLEYHDNPSASGMTIN